MLKRIFLVAAILIVIVAPLFAQPQNPQNDIDNPVPIGGIEILLAVGALFGIMKIITRKDISSERTV